MYIGVMLKSQMLHREFLLCRRYIQVSPKPDNLGKEDLSVIMLYRYAAPNGQCIVHTIRTPSNAYQAEVSGNITNNYLTELKALA